ncbi:hypothetical protein, partial [Burkholderia cenocepacia]|uniref:hypothetical protein n=1 Tax=Burkholderia cenocepacia TaxID=95486 RepID=UPI001B9D6D1A
RRRLRRVAALENASRPALTRFVTTPQALHSFTLKDVVRGSHTVEYVVELSARASRDLQAVLGDEFAGQQLDPKALIELIKEHRERVTKPIAAQVAA